MSGCVLSPFDVHDCGASCDIDREAVEMAYDGPVLSLPNGDYARFAAAAGVNGVTRVALLFDVICQGTEGG